MRYFIIGLYVIMTSMGGDGYAFAEDNKAFDVKTIHQSPYEKAELLIANPPKKFSIISSRLGFTVIEKVNLAGLSTVVYRLRVPRNIKIAAAKDLLHSKFPALSIDANNKFQAQGAQDFASSLPRSVIGWRKATPNCGNDIRIGMIDGAVDLSHPALDGQNIEYASFNKMGRVSAPANHGTAIAGMFVGKPEWGGLLPGASLVAANIFEIDETGRSVSSAMNLLKAINWLSEKNVHVVNMSIAGGDNEIVHKALDEGLANGLVIVAAAGNWGKNGNKPAFPAAYDKVIAVTAFGAGKLVYPNANTGAYIDFAAPGVQIYTPSANGGRLHSGTSFAAPFISVLIALANFQGNSDSMETLRSMLIDKTVDLGEKGYDTTYGNGFVDLQPKCM